MNLKPEAIDRLKVRGSGTLVLDVDAIVDSGFNGSLTLPTATVATLGLSRHSGDVGRWVGPAIRRIYVAEVSWEGV